MRRRDRRSGALSPVKSNRCGPWPRPLCLKAMGCGRPSRAVVRVPLWRFRAWQGEAGARAPSVGRRRSSPA